eukprot:CAMPEP_0194602766 /NCGR_PEP_ID=MMETSP0292-20121207/29852_1 /TAXON_ID=39354 /ORGANISM="Heterosigma akashiwo, Strain CCMP2393" /LENGTH=203 /DNA_ID=CAMNT_0039465085 /DNA_START=604 /DNA_END=1212 /DNA_ORIENTATION=-
MPSWSSNGIFLKESQPAVCRAARQPPPRRPAAPPCAGARRADLLAELRVEVLEAVSVGDPPGVCPALVELVQVVEERDHLFLMWRLLKLANQQAQSNLTSHSVFPLVHACKLEVFWLPDLEVTFSCTAIDLGKELAWNVLIRIRGFHFNWLRWLLLNYSLIFYSAPVPVHAAVSGGGRPGPRGAAAAAGPPPPRRAAGGGDLD